ncbi:MULTISPECIES: MFS transporter [Niastella]|uniref:MFS transporter n=1 Tax=Niastella soli TaxID=2821487 RepID=A0ABS3Z470_9BACT|nr:MFS transporter [Niastella soli]MBO9204445.1 MFS transporter [Niastella soli]
MPLKPNNKIINAWCWYDWANSSYSLVITSAIFPSYFLSLAPPAGNKTTWSHTISNSVLYAYMYSFASLLLLFLSPLFGSIADYSGRKKLFMSFFSYIGSVSCLFLFFSTADQMLLIASLFIISSVCYSLGVVFYNAYIPEITTPDQFDTVSAKGFAWGYLGGMIALVICLLVIQFAAHLGFSQQQIDGYIPVRVSFVFIGIWWLAFAWYSIKRLPADRKGNAITWQIIVQSYSRIYKAFHRARGHKAISIFLLAFFFYDMGLTTVMGMSSVFASKTLHLKTSHLIGVILILQLVAIFGSYVFLFIAKKINNIFAVKTAVLLWVLVCFIAYSIQSITQFYIMAILVGLVMGGTQALSRSAFAALIQEEKDEYATYFSLYDVLDKMGVVIGTFLFGLIEYITGSMRASVATLSVFFIIGFILLQLIKKNAWKK